MTTPAITVRDLRMRYGDTVAVDGASLTVAPGRVTAILGRNGAGKTTTVEVIAGVRRPQSGAVEVLGLPVSDRRSLAPRVGVMLQAGGVPTMARGIAFLRHLSRMYPDPLPTSELVDTLELVTRPVPFRRMSGGEQQRLRMACALVGRPELVLLDEPSAGLDPVIRQRVWSLIGQLRARGVTVLLSSHSFEEVDAVADDVIVMVDGSVRAAGSLAELTEGSAVTFRVAPDSVSDAARAALLECTASLVLREDAPGRYSAHGDVSPANVAEVARWASDHGLVLEDLRLARRSVADVFSDALLPGDPGGGA